MILLTCHLSGAALPPSAALRRRDYEGAWIDQSLSLWNVWLLMKDIAQYHNLNIIMSRFSHWQKSMSGFKLCINGLWILNKFFSLRNCSLFHTYTLQNCVLDLYFVPVNLIQDASEHFYICQNLHWKKSLILGWITERTDSLLVLMCCRCLVQWCTNVLIRLHN